MFSQNREGDRAGVEVIQVRIGRVDRALQEGQAEPVQIASVFFPQPAKPA